jgi:hypothetical protein
MPGTRGRVARRLRTPVEPKQRPGVQTSELYLTVAVIAIAVLFCFAGKITGTAAMAAVTGATGAYGVSRGLAKR